jgi:hypothetical protein
MLPEDFLLGSLSLPNDQQESDQESNSQDFNQQFIEDYIHTQKARIETRKLIQEMLFFTSCQIASATLAIILFQFAVQVLFTTWLCLFLAWIPTLSGLTEVNFQKTQDGWNLRIMNRPIITLIKFVSSVGIVTFTIYSISNEITKTANQINEVYVEIERYEHPGVENFLPPYFPQVILASIGIVLLLGLVRGCRDGNQ